MNKVQIEKSLRRAIDAAPTLTFEELADLPFIKMTEHDYITRQVEHKAPARFRQMALAAVCCLLVMVSVSGWFVQNRVSDSMITMDVNPSIEIITNKNDKVISLIALNDDGKTIIEGLDYKDAKLMETVNALLTSLVSNGYLSVDKRSILVSVRNKNTKKADAILASLDETIRESLVSQNITPTILKQLIPEEKDNAALSEEYNVSVGKMKLIQGILANQDKYTLDMLASMTIEELVQLAEENSIDLSKILGYVVDNEDYRDEGNGIVTPFEENSDDDKKNSEQIDNNENNDDNDSMNSDNNGDEDNNSNIDNSGNEDNGSNEDNGGKDGNENNNGYEENSNNDGNDVNDDNHGKNNNPEKDQVVIETETKVDNQENLRNNEGDEGYYNSDNEDSSNVSDDNNSEDKYNVDNGKEISNDLVNKEDGNDITSESSNTDEADNGSNIISQSEGENYDNNADSGEGNTGSTSDKEEVND